MTNKYLASMIFPLKCTQSFQRLCKCPMYYVADIVRKARRNEVN